MSAADRNRAGTTGHAWPHGPGGDLARRAFLRQGLLGAAALWLADQSTCPALGAVPAPRSRAGKAKAVIQIWMWGGPSHIDTFDPKPDAGRDYCGPYTSPIATTADGMRISQLLPLLAKQAQRFSIVRSTTHGVNGHETASYMVQTGRKTGELVYPSVGAVVSHFKGFDADYEGLVPPYIVLTRAQGRFSEAGFLGPRYKPFATGGDPAQERFAVEGVVAAGITDQRQRSRRDLLHDLDSLGRLLGEDERLDALRRSEEQAYDLILGDAGKVFDLSQEKPEVRERYGRSTFGQSCLAARRLVESGVPYITINYGGWDTHKQHFEIMRRKLPELDRGLATLLADLADRGLLDTTIVWCGGEFGRTPKVSWEPPWDGGRGHHGQVFSTLLAGGGFRGGCVVGASDARAENVADRPVYPWDLTGSLYELLGINPKAKLPHPQGLAIQVAPSPEEGYESGGLLREIM